MTVPTRISAFVLIVFLFLNAGTCQLPPPQPTLTPTYPSRPTVTLTPAATDTALPTLTPTPSPLPTTTPAPTLSPDEFFQAESQKWRVAYVDPSSRKLCVMYGDGSENLCHDYKDYDYPNGYRRKLGAWSPDGNCFAIDRNNDSGIYIWQPGGILTTFLQEGNGYVYGYPVWSPDGKFIAYLVGAVGGWDVPPDTTGLFIDSLDHTLHLHVGSGPSAPDWSPDGRHLAFMNAGIYLASADGTDADRLTRNSADGYPQWSPDGRSIAFLRVGEGKLVDVYVMNADGTEARPVAQHIWTNRFARFNYTWLPDGRHILYANQIIDLETGASSELHFPFDSSSAVWFMKPGVNAIIATPLPTCQ